MNDLKQQLVSMEYWHAGSVGLSRHVMSRHSKSHDTLKAVEGLNDWNQHINGAIAECAFAKRFNVYWDFAPRSKGNYKKPDVAGWQVRGTTILHGGLILRPRDDISHRYAFVTIDEEEQCCFIKGWCHGTFAFQDKYHRPENDKGGEFWLIPVADLTLFDPNQSLTELNRHLKIVA